MTDPPTARRDVLEVLREDLAAVRHPADGGGRAWLEEGLEAVAGEPGRFRLVYEAGPLGVAEGGWVMLQVSPFWGWSTPQVVDPAAPGFTEVRSDAPGLTLEPETLDRQLLGVRIGGRRLEPGERLVVVYGAGEVGAFADDFAESRAPLWIAVDGDGDGVRALVPDPPIVRVRAGPPARLRLTLPATARPGESVRLVAAVLDAAGNAGVEVAGEVVLDTGLEGPATVSLPVGGGGAGAVELRAPAAGDYEVWGSGPGGLAAVSNPLRVSDGPRLLWADLHGHSALSDGTGTPEEYFRYARDVAGLDVVALTDHDHWGMEPLALRPANWEEILRQVEAFHEPGRFVTVPGYEWTNWVHGHRHVLYFGGGGEVLSAVDPAYERPDLLWAALAGRRALTFAHHSAGGPVATDWRFPPDPVLEPVTEIASVHGASEAADAPGVIYSAVLGNFVRDALGRGYRLGFVGSGDGHDGHPGLAGLAIGQGGLAAIFAEDRTRDAVLEALRARRVYATNGPRILLRTSLGGAPMGSTLAATETAGELLVELLGTAPIARVELIRSGRVVERLEGAGVLRADLRLPLAPPRPGDWLYLRVVQTDGGAAWSSPYFFD